MASESQNGQRDQDRQSDLAVMGIDEYKQKRKLERILDNMHAIGDKSRESWNEYVNGEINAHAKNIAILQNVKEAIRDCETMLKQYAEDQTERDYYWAGHKDDPIGTISQHRGDDIPVVGLRDFLKLNVIWFEEWQEQVKPDNLPPRKVPRQIKHSVPETVSRDAASRLALYLSRERGIELTTEQKEIEVHADPW